MTPWQKGFVKTSGLFDKGVGAAGKLLARGEAAAASATGKAADRAFLAANKSGGYGKLHAQGVGSNFNVSGNQMAKPLTKAKYTDIK